MLLPVILMFGGASLLAVLAVEAWGLYVPLLGLTSFALGLGWTLPNIGTQAVVDPVRAGEASGVSLTAMVTIGGVAVAVAGTLIKLGGAGSADIEAATTGLLRMAAGLSIAAGAILLITTLAGTREARQPRRVNV